MKTVAFVPLKTFSRRLYRKNFLEIGGMAAFNHVVSAALKSNLFDEVRLSTDDPELVEQHLEIRSELVHVDKRSSNTQSFELPIKKVLIEELGGREDISKLCLLYATAVQLDPDRLISSFKKLTGQFKSVMGVCEIKPHPFRGFELADGTYLPTHSVKKKDPMHWPTIYSSNGSFVWIDFPTFVEEGEFYLQPMAVEVMHAYEHVDLDDQEDLAFLRKVFGK